MRKQQNSFITESYLRKENEELKQQILQLKELLEYNKNALKVSINYSANNQSQQKPFQKLINNLYNQNNYLKDLLKQKQIQIDNTNSKVLINQQIVQACQDHQKTLVQQLKGKIIELKMQIKEKQKKILELEKITPQLDIENSLLIKYNQITNPTHLAMKYHDQAQTIRSELKVKQQELLKQKQIKEDVFKLNIALTKQINDLKNYGIVPATNMTKNQNRNSNDLNQILECHQKIFNNQSMSQQEYSDVSSHQSVDQKKKQKMAKIVPKLELGKAKQIQQIIVKKINAEDKKKGKGEMVKGQQFLLLKKSLNRQMLKNLMLTKKIDKLLRILKETEQRNIILLRKLQSKQLITPKQVNNQFEVTLLQKNPYEEVMQLGKDVYMNQNIERVINGDFSPQIKFECSRSFC